jgi:hypothetical protein
MAIFSRSQKHPRRLREIDRKTRGDPKFSGQVEQGTSTSNLANHVQHTKGARRALARATTRSPSMLTFSFVKRTA